MKRTLRYQHQSFQIDSSAGLGGAKNCLIFDDIELAGIFLRKFLIEESQAKILRDILAEHSLHSSASLWQQSDSQVIDQLAILLTTGRLRFEEYPPVATSVVTFAPVEAEEVEYVPLAPAPKKKPAEKHWVKFQVVDDVSGDAVAGVTVEIKLPGGKSKKYKTNNKGEIEIKDLDSGTCDIMDLQGKPLLEVVKLG
jgi:hypothetical protein